MYISSQTKRSSCGRWARGTRGRRATTWRRTVGCWGTRAASPASGCRSSSPWSSWWRPVRGGYSPMLTLTTSTLSQSTQTRSVVLVLGRVGESQECFSNLTAKACLKAKSCPDRLTVNKHLCSLHLLCPSVWSFSNLVMTSCVTGDLSLSGRSEDQLVAHGDHRPVIQHRGHQAGQHGGAHRGHHSLRVSPQGV